MINMLEIGIDEAGRGPVIGPLVVCSVAIPHSDVKLLSDVGVKDSKDLSADKRAEIQDWFFRQCKQRGWLYSIISCDAKRVDNAVYGSGLNVLETELFAESVNDLNLKKDTNVNIICDACDVDAVRFTRRVSQLIDMWPWGNSQISSFHKADENYPIVGMASIIAKQARDAAIELIQQGVDYPIGSGYPSDKVTIEAVRMMIGEIPHDHLRWSWSTVKRIWDEKFDHEMPTRLVASGQQKKLF